jgi:hypothetical protein
MLGYPEDKRSAAQQAKAAADILGDVEHVAARVVARLAGETVTIQDDNSVDGLPDIRIDYRDGRVGYVEMTSTLRAKDNQLPRELVVPELDRVWFLGLSKRVKYDQLDRELPVLLDQLEKAGVTPCVFNRRQELAESENTHLRRLAEFGVADIGGERIRLALARFTLGRDGDALRVVVSLHLAWRRYPEVEYGTLAPLLSCGEVRHVAV